MLIIVATIEAEKDRVDFVKAELQKLIPITREEAGCVQYDLHQDNENPAIFLFFERWESRELWQDHMNSPHLAALQNATADAVSNTTIYEMTPVE